MDGLTTVASLIDGVKAIININANLKNAELNEMLVLVQNYVLDLQFQFYQLQEEKQQLTNELKACKTQMLEEKDIEEDSERPFITLKSDPKRIRYCANCWHQQRKKVRFNIEPLNGRYCCPQCPTKMNMTNEELIATNPKQSEEQNLDLGEGNPPDYLGY